MKIVTLDRDQMRAWFRNRPVLVDNETGEAILVDGKPRNPTKDEVLALLKAIKKKQLYDVEVNGKKCHFVNGREFLCRTFARAFKQPVQLRTRTGQVVGSARPKFIGHDLEKSEVRPIDSRPFKQAKVDLPEKGPQPVVGPTVVPPPHLCPKCKDYSKPLGCRSDEHHFVCTFHDRWEEIRRQKIAENVQKAQETRSQRSGDRTRQFPHPSQDRRSEEGLQAEAAAKKVVEPEPITEPDPTSPEDTELYVICLDTGTPLRPATDGEIKEAKQKLEKDELPLVTIDGVDYTVGTSNFALA